MDAETFYSLFRKHFNPEVNKEVKRIYSKDITWKQGEWTSLMNKVLLDLMKDAGFAPSTHSKEIPVIRGKSRGLVDHKWQNRNEIIMLEHENKMDSRIDTEVKNLLNSDADLKILITYSSKNKERKDLREKILSELKDSNSRRQSEFLLIMGRDVDMNDYDNWEAFVYQPTYEVFPL